MRRRYVEQGLATALGEAPRSGGPRRFDGAARAALTARACTAAPTGHRCWTLRCWTLRCWTLRRWTLRRWTLRRWTLRLLADKAVDL